MVHEEHSSVLPESSQRAAGMNNTGLLIKWKKEHMEKNAGKKNTGKKRTQEKT